MGLIRALIASYASAAWLDATNPQRLVDNNLGGNLTITILKALFTNVDVATAVTLTVWVAPRGTASGSFTGDDFIFAKAYSIGPSDGTFPGEDMRELAGMVIPNGYALFAKAGTASKIKYHIAVDQES